ncbi:MAG: hypothetical protein Q8R42_05040, partial [Desulfocapsaceae bacterium]|nr:hypothetical protein [Desulfocapsaceae bacterium]
KRRDIDDMHPYNHVFDGNNTGFYFSDRISAQIVFDPTGKSNANNQNHHSKTQKYSHQLSRDTMPVGLEKAQIEGQP